jgi:hypothetical protein
LAEHLENISHDAVSDFLHNAEFDPQDLWEVVKDRLADSPEAYLLVDDSVQNKRYSQVIETVKVQYSGNEHGLVRGIGLVNLVHTDGWQGSSYPIDYRVYDPDHDGQSKNEHFREMFRAAHAEKQVQARRIAFDSWYAGAENLKLIHRSGWTFYTTLKSNRKVSLSKETGYDKRAAGPGATGWQTGRIVTCNCKLLSSANWPTWAYRQTQSVGSKQRLPPPQRPRKRNFRCGCSSYPR